MKTKSDKTSTTKFDYTALKTVANDHERAGRWAEAAKVWTQVAEQSPNKMIIDNANRRAKSALKNAADGEPVEVVVPVRDAGAPAANDTPVEEAAAPTAPPPANDANVGEPGANDAQPEAAAPAPKPRDARLPEVGTVIQKRDRKGELRAECKVVDGGIEYKGVTYKSLSSAALAASKDLGLGASTLDGWAWWGLKAKMPAEPRATKTKDVVAPLERAFTKYRDKAAAIVKATSGDDLAKVLSAIRAQGAALLAMVEPGESSES